MKSATELLFDGSGLITIEAIFFTSSTMASTITIVCFSVRTLKTSERAPNALLR